MRKRIISISNSKTSPSGGGWWGLFTFVFLVMAGCADYESTEVVAPGGDPLDLHCELQQQYITRASDGGFATGDEIGVFIVNYPDPPAAPELHLTGNHADNVLFTYNADDGKWTGARQLYWKDKKTHIDAYGYYPFDEELGSVTAYPFQIQRNQRDNLKTGRQLSGYEASDFLWAKAEDYTPGNGLVMLKFRHQMAGIEVSLLEGEGFLEGEWDELDKTVLVESTILDATINLQTGSVCCVSNATNGAIIPQQQREAWRAVVVPQTVAAQKSLFSITVGTESHRFTRDEQMTYYPGKLHKFTIEVVKRLPQGDYQFNLISEAITPWENDLESHNGMAREYLTIHLPDVHSDIGHIIDSLGIDPKEIVNLKVTGVTGSNLVGHEWHGPIMDGVGNRTFDYIRENMPNIEAINMKELRLRYLYSPWPYQDKWIYAFIPECSFEGLRNLSYFVFPDSLKILGDCVFMECSLKGSLIIPEGVEEIGTVYGWLGGHVPRGELYLPSTLKRVGNFDVLCYFTNELVLPEYMKVVGSFRNCKYMTGSMRYPRGVTEVNNIWPDHFCGSFVVPQGVKKVNGIGVGTTSISIPEGVEEIGGCGTPNLRGDVRLPSTLRVLHAGAFYGSSISHINLPEGLEFIEDEVFRYCGYLQDTITIPSTVTRIKGGAFGDCHMLNAVIIPASVEEIQNDAFQNCFSLDYIECQGKVPPMIYEWTFSGVEKNNFTVVVPEDAVEAYKNAPYWSEFKRISAYRNFVCRPMKAKLLNKGHVREVVLNADTDWQMVSCPSWMHVNKTSGHKKTELQITIDDMPHNQGDREGEVVFRLNKTDEDGNPITCNYQVKQFDYEVEEDGVFSLQQATKGRQGGIDILFVGDGYDAEDIATGTYRDVIEKEMEYFFAVEPYKTYKDYFNVSVAVAMSYESGIHDNPDKWRQPKFGTVYGVSDTGRMGFNFDECMGYVLQEVDGSPITAANVDRSLVIAVPNATAYEGVTMMYGSGAALAVCPYFEGSYPNDARGIIQHEAGGHAWGKLDDEYVYHRDHIAKCGCVCCSHVEGVQSMKAMGWARNLTLSGKYKNCEWRHLIFDPRYSDIVDVYEGGHMHGQGVFRSEVNSCMNNNVPYFSTISRQTIVERILWAAGETFDFETFVGLDSREMGEKFITRGDETTTATGHYYSEHHGAIIRKGSPLDYLGKIEN